MSSVQFNLVSDTYTGYRSAGPLSDAGKPSSPTASDPNTPATTNERQYTQIDSAQLDDRLSGLLEMLPAAVILVDGRGRVDRFNQAAEILFPNLSWGRRWHEVAEERLLDTAAENEWLLKGDLCVRVTGRTLADAGQILVLLDITDQRRLERQLLRQERLSVIGEMASQLAHQIRTPLATAVLYAGHLSNARASVDERARYGTKLLERLRHTEQLIADMLTFARGGHFLAEQTDLRQVVEDAIDIVTPRLTAQRVRLDWQANGISQAPLQGNRDALIGAIVNLLNNSLDQRQGGASIAMELNRERDQFRVTVRDDGPGVRAELRDRIFDPFFTTREGGTGLGLAVVQAVAIEHGGSIDYAGTADSGAVFELRLPGTQDPHQARSDIR